MDVEPPLPHCHPHGCTTAALAAVPLSACDGAFVEWLKWLKTAVKKLLLYVLFLRCAGSNGCAARGILPADISAARVTNFAACLLLQTLDKSGKYVDIKPSTASTAKGNAKAKPAA